MGKLSFPQRLSFFGEAELPRDLKIPDEFSEGKFVDEPPLAVLLCKPKI
ncbi:hypothetical protein L6261_00510 [Candidatus Parcubacteria bacterium]|nr:hypothetical protein [Candidatus Parcubacteria bacterium]